MHYSDIPDQMEDYAQNAGFRVIAATAIKKACSVEKANELFI